MLVGTIPTIQQSNNPNNPNNPTSPWTLATILVASVLPDCDHTHSPIGKLLFPLAKWLNRRFGHRTITHSIPALVALTLLVSFVEKTYFDHFRVSIAFYLAYWSHLLFDMLPCREPH